MMLRALDALAAHDIDHHDLAVLAWLHARGPYDGTLADLHVGLAWPYLPDHLSKRLRRLKHLRLVDYDAGAGRSTITVALRASDRPSDRFPTDLPTDFEEAGIAHQQTDSAAPAEDADRLLPDEQWRWPWRWTRRLRLRLNDSRAIGLSLSRDEDAALQWPDEEGETWQRPTSS